MTGPAAVKTPDLRLQAAQGSLDHRDALLPRAFRHFGRLLDNPLGAIGALICLGVILPALVSIATGAFGLPWNDDWTYRNTALQFFDSGHLRYDGWSSMTLVGQVLWSWPFLRLFGNHDWVFSASTMVMASGGLASGYYLARQSLTPRRALAAVALLLLLPGEALSASTFMTDVPSLSATLICLAVGVSALKTCGRRHWILLAASLLLGLFAFSIREFALAGPVAVLAVAGLSSRSRTPYLVLGLLLLGLSFGLYEWSEHLPGLQRIPLSFPSAASISRLVQAYFTLSLMLSPPIAFVALRRRVIPRAAVMIGILVLLLGAECYQYSGGVLIGNYIDPHGMVTAVLGGLQPMLFGATVWSLLSLSAVFSGALLALEMSSRLIERRSLRIVTSLAPSSRVINVFALLSVAGSAVYTVTAYVSFDRYLWPLAFPLGILLIGWAHDDNGLRPLQALASRWMCAVAATLLCVLTVALTVNADTFLAARWHAGHVAVAEDIPASATDAGIEWVGIHNPGPVHQKLDRSAPTYEPFYAYIHPGFQDCAVTSASPLVSKHLRLLARLPYERYGLFGMGVLYVYSTVAAGCPS